MTVSDFFFYPFGFGLIMIAGLLLEALFGYPPALFKAIGHPVSWMGAMLSWLERTFNKPEHSNKAQFIWGGSSLTFLLIVVGSVSVSVQLFLLQLPYGVFILCLLSASLLAGRSLYVHVVNVARALEQHGVKGGRKAVALLVGRDPDGLDEAGVARAATESLAENFSDGVAAPLFWGALLGLPGIALYKAVNTADSMIGHRTERYEYFGKCAARVDDVLNFIPARLSGVALSLATFSLTRTRLAFSAIARDASHHLSPNAGWPEAAMAGALDLRLGGPRLYGDREIAGTWLGSGRATLNAQDIRRGLHLYIRATVLYGTGLGILTSISVGGAIWS